MRKRTIILLFVLAVMGAVTVCWYSSAGAKKSDQSGASLPDPNGYDDFLKAAEIVKLPRLPGTNATADELRALVRLNEDALRLLLAGLTKDCRVPIGFSTGYYTETNQAIALECRALEMVLEAQGRLSEMEHHTNDAERTYLDALQFSHESARGGFKINLAVGGRCESSALDRLRQLSGGFDVDGCRLAIKTLGELDRKREPVADVLARDQKWWNGHSGLSERFKFMPALAKDPSMDPMKISPESLESSAKDLERQSRQLMIDLAARCYQLEKGARPKNADALVPVYLSAVPKDPSAGTNMVYGL